MASVEEMAPAAPRVPRTPGPRSRSPPARCRAGAGSPWCSTSVSTPTTTRWTMSSVIRRKNPVNCSLVAMKNAAPPGMNISVYNVLCTGKYWQVVFNGQTLDR